MWKWFSFFERVKGVGGRDDFPPKTGSRARIQSPIVWLCGSHAKETHFPKKAFFLGLFWKWEFWNSDIACDFIPLSWKPQQLTYPKTTFFRRYFALNALKENRIQVFRLAFTYGPAVTVTSVTRPVVPVCRHLTAEWLPRLSGVQSPSRLISSGV